MTAERDLCALLDAIHAALAAGRMADLPALSAALAAAAEGIVPPAGEGAPRLRARLARNAACLEATARGLRAGRRRLAEIAAAAQPSTYGAGGARAPLDAPPSRLAQWL